MTTIQMWKEIPAQIHTQWNKMPQYIKQYLIPGKLVSHTEVVHFLLEENV